LGELTQKVISGQMLDLRSLAPGLPESLYALSAQTLVADPTQRVPDARAFANGIHNALRNVDQATMNDTDRTVVMAPAAPAAALSQTMAAQMPKSALARIEALLTTQIGPIAKVLVRRVSASTTDTGQLINQLAAEIGPEHREAFKAAVQAHLGQTGSSVTGAGPMLSEELLAALTRELVPHIGPIAKILIKKTAKSCRSREELCEALSAHIDDPATRAAFLQTMR
jgi:serine/threonine-protein kinase